MSFISRLFDEEERENENSTGEGNDNVEVEPPAIAASKHVASKKWGSRSWVCSVHNAIPSIE